MSDRIGERPADLYREQQQEARLRRLANAERCPNCTKPLCDWDGFAWQPELKLAHAMQHIAETNAAIAADIAEIRRLLGVTA